MARAVTLTDHYRYEYSRDLKTVTAIVNVGHTGTILNCMHPACAALRVKDNQR
jgi:hypothetical protein